LKEIVKGREKREERRRTKAKNSEERSWKDLKVPAQAPKLCHWLLLSSLLLLKQHRNMSGNNKNKWTTTQDGTDYLDLITPTKPEQASSANNLTTTPNGTIDLLTPDDDNDAKAYSKDCQNMKRGIRTADLGNRDNERSKKAAAAAPSIPPNLKPPRVSTSPRANDAAATAAAAPSIPPKPPRVSTSPRANTGAAAAAAAVPSIPPKPPRVSTSPRANNTPPTSKAKTDAPPSVDSDVAVANEDDFEEGRDKEVELRAIERQRGRRVREERIEEVGSDVEETNANQVGVGGLKNDADYENNKEGEGKVADAAGTAAAESTEEVSFLEVSQQYLSIPFSLKLFSLS
jgi:hypothetical protein